MKTTYKEVKPLTKERLFGTIENAFAFAKQNEFVIKGGENFHPENAKIILEAALIKSSGNRRKKLNKMIRHLEYKMTRKGINLFFHFLNTRLELGMPVKFEPSELEQTIVKHRKEFKTVDSRLKEMIEKFKTDNNYDLKKTLYKELKKQYYGVGKLSSEYFEK